MAVLLVVSAANGGMITGPVQFTDDATSGISPTKIYTHLLDMGYKTTPVAVINGVAFTQVIQSGNPTTLTGPNWMAQTYPVPPNTIGFNDLYNYNIDYIGVPAGSGAYNLLYDQMYTHGQHSKQVWTLTGLTPGVTYDCRLYYRTTRIDRDRFGTVTFDEDGGGPLGSSIYTNEDYIKSAPYAASYLSYVYTATTGGTLTIEIVHANPGEGWHIYGLSNEVVPEPSTLTLLACGLVGLLCYAWRKRT